MSWFPKIVWPKGDEGKQPEPYLVVADPATQKPPPPTRAVLCPGCTGPGPFHENPRPGVDVGFYPGLLEVSPSAKVYGCLACAAQFYVMIDTGQVYRTGWREQAVMQQENGDGEPRKRAIQHADINFSPRNP